MHRFSSEDGVRRKRKKENRREMREGREWGGDTPTLNPSPWVTSLSPSFFSAPFSHGQTLPATARTQATMKEESKMALEQCCITV